MGTRKLTPKIATDPPVSEKQRRAMFAAKAGHSTLGIPQSVGAEFAAADPGGKLPSKAKDMAPGKWAQLRTLISQWLSEEAAEPEHQAADAATRAAGVAFVTPQGDCLWLKRAARGHAGDHATEWCLPGGMIEDEETPEQAAIREAKEETGADAHEGAGGLMEAHKHIHDGVDFTTFYQPVAGKFNPTLNDEHTDFAWAPPDAPPEPLHPGVRKTLDEIMGGLGEDDGLATSPNSGIPAGGGEIEEDIADPTGKLSETTHEDIDSQQHRDDMPKDAFLGPNETYPVKEKRDGEWRYTRNLLLAAARRARMQGRQDLARRADDIRAREFGASSEGEDAEFEEGKHPRGEGGKFSKAAAEHHARAEHHETEAKKPTKYSSRHRTAMHAHREAAKANEFAESYPKRKDKLPMDLPPEHFERRAITASRQANSASSQARPTHKAEASWFQREINTMQKRLESEKKRGNKPGQSDIDRLRSYYDKLKFHRDAEAAGKKYVDDSAKDAGLPSGRMRITHQSDPNGGFGWAIGGRVGTGQGQMRMSRAVGSGNVSLTGDMALDHALATDRKQYDADGRLHVDQANISKANVCEYLGREINAVMKGEPGWRMLEPERRYKLLRDPKELAKAASSFNGLPILFTHKPASAQDHPTEITVGATGNDAVFEHPYLRNSLSIWPAYASQAIEDGDQKQLSCGYAYRADMTPGEFEGEKYDGVMRDLRGNHLALVREGRAGTDVAIDESHDARVWRNIETALIRMGSPSEVSAP